MADLQRKTANLFDKDNADTQNIYVYTGETTVRYNQNTISIVFPCKASTTYSISKIVSSRFAIGYTNSYPQNNTPAYGIIADDTATTLTITTGSEAQYIVIFVSYIPAETRSIQEIVESIMINEGSSALPYEPYWVHSLRKLDTASDDITTFPATIYGVGEASTDWNLEGNTVQNGTPIPVSPVDVVGVGKRTENLLPNVYENHGFIWDTGEIMAADDPTRLATMDYSNIFSGNVTCSVESTESATYNVCLFKYDKNKNYLSNTGWQSVPYTYDVGTERCVRILVRKSDNSNIDVSTVGIMLNTGSTALPYQPYGYNISILNGQQTTNIYLGSTQTLRQIKKLVLDGTGTWRKYTGTDNKSFFYLAVDNSVAERPVCTHYQGVYISTNSTNIGVDISNDGNLRVRPENSDSYQTSDFTAWLTAQYAAGTPVTVWYILAAAEIGIVNEQLHKIGDYADSITQTQAGTAIQLSDGKSTLDIDSDVKPSKLTLTYKGWHDAYVKEKSENIYNNIAENYRNGQYVNGEWQETPSRVTSQMIPIEGGNSFNIILSGQIAALINFNYFDESYNWLGNRSTQGLEPTTDTQTDWNTTTLPDNAHYLCFTFAYYGDRSHVISASDMITINIMVNKGSTALPYEPYWK